MGIETIGSVATGIASSAGRVACSVGSLESFGPKLGVSVPTFVNEGPVRGGLEWFKPIVQINFKTSELNAADAVLEAQLILSQAPRPRLGGIKFLQQESLSAPAVIAEAESIISQAQRLGIDTVTPDVISVSPVIPARFDDSARRAEAVPAGRQAGIHIDNYLWIPLSKDTSYQVGDDKPLESIITPQIEPMIMPVVTLPENAVGVEPAELEEQEVEEVLEEVVEERTDLVEEEEIDKEQRFYLVDKRALVQRIFEIRRAFRQAKAETEKSGGRIKGVLGKLIAKFMPLEHPGNRSAVVQPFGPDGSYDETKATIETGQFSSEDQAEVVALVNRPVEIGKDGEHAGEEEVKKVFKRRFIKPVKAIEIARKRIIKKKVQTVSGQNQISVQEPDLRVLGLEKVFQKAA